MQQIDFNTIYYYTDYLFEAVKINTCKFIHLTEFIKTGNCKF